MLPGPSKYFLPLLNKTQVILFCLENISQIGCVCLPVYLLFILWEGEGGYTAEFLPKIIHGLLGSYMRSYLLYNMLHFFK
jgi:hypothetical protein